MLANTIKAGIASGIARRKKSDLRKALKTIMECDVSNQNIKQQLESLGLVPNNEALLAFSLFQKAVKGDTKASAQIIELTSKKDELDKKEQKERIELIKAQRKLVEQNTIGENAGTEHTLKNYFDKIDKELDK